MPNITLANAWCDNVQLCPITVTLQQSHCRFSKHASQSKHISKHSPVQPLMLLPMHSMVVFSTKLLVNYCHNTQLNHATITYRSSVAPLQQCEGKLHFDLHRCQQTSAKEADPCNLIVCICSSGHLRWGINLHEVLMQQCRVQTCFDFSMIQQWTEKLTYCHVKLADPEP